ncbi:MAG: TIGR02466 family protein [Paracoccaceae bacterium]
MNMLTPEIDSAPRPEAGTPDLLEMNENQYFPTQIFSYLLPSELAEKVNAKLLRSIRAKRAQDAEGIQRSNFRALGGWHSQNDLHEDADYADVVELINRCSETISARNEYHPDSQLRIGTMWAIINPPGSANRAHVHPNSSWSGVYYVQAPTNAGDIDFTDPRTQHVMAPMRYVPKKKRPQHCWTKVNFTPVAGKILIFPSWLYHSVAPNLSTARGKDSERVVISFNLSQERRKPLDCHGSINAKG